MSLAQARDSLIEEVRKLGSNDFVITSNLPTRLDGMPYASGRVVEPGIAAYWRERKLRSDGRHGYQERVMACDRWSSPEANMRAIALSIGALRGLDRWGSSSLVERAFAGFAALPSNPVVDWRIELGLGDIDPDYIKAIDAREAYRRRARELHPDHGGDPERMMRLNQAWEAAQRELGA